MKAYTERTEHGPAMIAGDFEHVRNGLLALVIYGLCEQIKIRWLRFWRLPLLFRLEFLPVGTFNFDSARHFYVDVGLEYWS